MDDFLLGLLGFILEILVESLDEIALSEIIDGVSRLLRYLRINVRRSSALVAATILISTGVLLGFLSVLVFPHHLVHSSKHHGISLLISPLISGFVMSAIGRGVRKRGRLPVRIESFSYGFAFAFAFALIRILMVR